MLDETENLLPRSAIERNMLLAGKLVKLLELLLPRRNAAASNDWSQVIKLLDPNSTGRVCLTRWVLVAMKALYVHPEESAPHDPTAIGTVEFTAVVWVALDPHERGSAEIGKTMAFLRSVAALHSVGGGLMRAQGLHRTLVDAFRLHGGGGGVQAMSEIVRSPYNPGTAARAAQSFA